MQSCDYRSWVLYDVREDMSTSQKAECTGLGCSQGKSSSLSRFTQKVSGMVPSFRSDSAGVSSADGQPDRIDDGQAVQPRSKTLAKFRGKLFGNKNKLPPGTVDIPPSAFDYGSSMSMQQVTLSVRTPTQCKMFTLTCTKEA